MPDTPRLTRIAPIGVLRMIRERPRAGDPLHPAPDARRQTQSAQERGRTLKTKAKAAADRPGQERRAVDGGVDRVAAGRARVWLLASRLGAYRARPRLRRRFSAALSLRGFGRALDPARLPSASIGVGPVALRGAPAGVAPDEQRDPAEHDDRSDRDDDRRAPGEPTAAAGGRGRLDRRCGRRRSRDRNRRLGKPPLSGLVVWAPADAGSVSATGPTSATAETAPAIATTPASRHAPHRPQPPPAPKNPPDSHGPALRERLLHRRRVGRGDVGLLVLDVFLVVHALGVDRPDVVVGPRGCCRQRASRSASSGLSCCSGAARCVRPG